MHRKQNTVIIAMLITSLLFVTLFTSACVSTPEPVQVQTPVHEAETLSVDNLTTVQGTVRDLGVLNYPYFNLVTGTGETRVWYDRIVGPDGTRLPATGVGNFSNGDKVLITGTLQAGGYFRASRIDPAPPRLICHCPMKPAGQPSAVPTATPDDGLCHCS